MFTKGQLKELSEFFNIDFFDKVTPPNERDTGEELLIADVHQPFTHKEAYQRTLDENKKADKVIIAGDWFDFYSKSHYRKTANISFGDEFRIGYFELVKLARLYPKVYLMLSNHDMRFKKWVFDNVPTEMLNFTRINLVEDLLRLIPNLRIMKQPSASGRMIDYIYQYRNIIITHIEKSNKDITKTAQEIVKDLYKWKSTLGLKDFNMVIQAHNHQSGRVKWGDVWVCQSPCLIDITAPSFDYVFNGKLQGNPPALGYTKLIIENKKINANKSHIVDF